MMVSQNIPTAPVVLDQWPFTYKGHPHPPVDERLKQARNFLADEDVNRCLGFTSKLAEIEEFLSHVEKENLPRNKYLFGDVKVMVDVQKDWMKWMDKPPDDYDGPDAPCISRHSTRLINADTAKEFQRQREAYGVITQMREDHAPFTIERSSDQVEFLNTMRRDACTDPEEVDLATNLLFVEHRAYDWALREPSLIPHWMHWSRGLPSKGIKPSDPSPWYRESLRMSCSAKVPRAPALRPHDVFLREVLPDYLQCREDEINRMLKSHKPGAVSSSLADLLNFHAPRSLQELREEQNYLSSIEDLLSVEERLTLSSITSTLDKKLKEWVEILRPSGVQIRLSHANWVDPHTPGIFYVTDGQPTARDYTQLEEREGRINSLLESSSLSTQELLKELDDFLPAKIRSCGDRAQAILIHAGNKTHTTFSKLSQTQREEFNKEQLGGLNNGNMQSFIDVQTQKSITYDSWLAALRASSPVTLKFLRPGEIATASPSQLLLPWIPAVEAPLQLPPPEVRKLESDINDCLYMIETDGKTKASNVRLDRMLDSVMCHYLREMKQPVEDSKNGNAKVPTPPKTPKPKEPKPPSKVPKSYRVACLLWKEFLLSRKVEIRMPQNGTDSDFSPAVLYYRGINDGLDHPAPHDDDLIQWAAHINAARKHQSPSAISEGGSLNNMESTMYGLLAHLQYPMLKRIDVAWKTLKAMPSRNVKTVSEFRASWVCRFKKWLAMLLDHRCPIVIERANQDDEILGDPGVVYYRGDISEADSRSDPEEENSLPADIQKQLNQINGLLQMYSNNKDKNTLDELESLLREFWRPAREHNDNRELLNDQKLKFDEIEQLHGLGNEFKKRLLLLIEQSATVGCKLKKDRSGNYEVEDPTAKLPEQWRIRKDHQSLDRNPLYIGMLLNHLWKYPKRFYRTLRDVEVEINDRLKGLSPSRPPSDEQNARLLQLMRPFLPHAIAELAHQLENAEPTWSAMYSAAGLQHGPIEKSFIALYAQWLRGLQRLARTKWIKILVWDEGELSSESFLALEGRLYFSKPQDTSTQGFVEDEHLPDSLPVRFRRYQKEINYLLKRRKLQSHSPEKTTLSWQENDRLRQLLHLVMNPVIARADDELRIIDEKSRVDILQGEELTSYLSRFEAWQAKYNQWVDSFPDGGIELQHLDEDTPRNSRNEGIRYVYIGNEQLLPSPFRNRRVPLHVQRMTRDFNTALRARNLTNLEQKAIYGRYLPLIKATYREDINTLREYFFREQFPEKVSPDSQIPPHSEMNAILQCVENLALKTIWERLRQIASSGRRTGQSFEIYEQLRGDLRIRLKSADSPAGSEDEDDGIEVIRPISKVSAIVIPGIDEAKNEYLLLAEKVRSGVNLRESERAEIVRHFQPLSDKERVAETEAEIIMILKVFDGKQLTDSEEMQARELMLRSLWQQFAKDSADLVERACPELRYARSVESVLNQVTPPTATQRPPSLSPAPTEAEVREVGTEINNLLQKFRDWTISEQEDKILDYLLRPLVDDRLRELDKQMKGLDLVSRSADRSTIQPYQGGELNPRQSIHLVELLTQWSREFEKWKTNLPRYGVIIDEWFSEPDVIPNVMSRYRAVRENLRRSLEHDLKDQEPLEIFLILKRYITDCAFTDDGGKLMLERLPADVASLRDVLFNRKQNLSVRNRRLSLSESLSLNLLEHDFVSSYMAWYNAVPLREKMLFQLATITDFTGKAERRGVQRAAIELALNLLATNQEQHRPLDKFRRVVLPPRYQPPPKEVRLCLDLEPWKRPIEQDPFKLTKMLLKYRKWKDHLYAAARARAIDTHPGHLEPPANYNGPSTLASEDNVWSSVRRRENQLVQIQAALIQAGKVAPRPLIYRLTTLINEALIVPPNEMSYSLSDEDQLQLLEAKDLQILSSLCASSWNEEHRPYPELILGNADNDRARLNEFERDVNLFMNELPLWEPVDPSPPTSIDPSEPEFYIQTQYDAHVQSKTGWDLNTLVQVKINKSRQERAKNLHEVYLWSASEATRYLAQMHNAGRIHFESTQGQERVAKIPPSGHPENKYIVTLDQMQNRHYIRFNARDRKWQVQYDAAGNIGQPILQPNLYEYLQNVAYNVGRDIRQLHHKIGQSHTEAQRLKDQSDSLLLTRNLMDGVTSRTGDQLLVEKEISLRKIARDLHQVAPDLVQESLVDLESERGSATIIQMQLIQESNNNWESLFPGKEHVWDFAASRLSPASVGSSDDGKSGVKQYFNMRRWPLWAQSNKTQETIKFSNIVIQEKPAPRDPLAQAQEVVKDEGVEEVKRERYTGRGGPPLFPFGETPYQQAYLSWRMEQELADVEEFNPKPPRRRFFSRKPKVVEEPPINPHTLPSIPDSWQPDSVSLQEKWYDVTERARKVEGFPQNLEYYYTEEEVEVIKSHEEEMKAAKLQEEARALVEAHARRRYSELTRDEIQAAHLALGIDPFTGTVTQKPAPSTSSRRLPVISRLFGKRKAEERPSGPAPAPKRTRPESDGSEDEDADFGDNIYGTW